MQEGGSLGGAKKGRQEKGRGREGEANFGGGIKNLGRYFEGRKMRG